MWPGFVDKPSGAVFSDDQIYRYLLWRKWSEADPLCYVLLNPSTATEVLDDPTIRRCIGFAKRENAGGMFILNMFGLRSTDPKGLYKIEDPEGPENIRWIQEITTIYKRAIVAWGAHGSLMGQNKKILDCLQNNGVLIRCFGITKSGNPKHPLYLRNDTELVNFGRINECL